MKYINLYYVYDGLDKTVVTPVIPSNDHLTAALGFRDSYIMKKNKNLPYKNLKLVCCGRLLILENGCYKQDVSYEDFELKGNEVIDYIRQEILNRGLDDGFLDEEDN